MNEKVIRPIGFISTPYKEKFGIPRQSKRCSAKGIITLEPEFSSVDAVREIECFSHLWLIFEFDKAKENSSLLVRPPRLGGNKKVGVFASRSPFRPNTLGLSSVKLEKVLSENGKVQIVVSGVDLLDGTPIFDIKPYIPSSDKIEDAIGGYSEEFTEYKLDIIFPEELRKKIDKNYILPIIESLVDDPRPAYHEDGKEYGMRYENYNLKFFVNEKTLTVTKVEIL